MTILAHKVYNNTTRLPNIKNIIAVTSGKGGVGKSTTAFNLAISLSKLNLKVGLLDADIYGPSVPTLVGEKSFHPEVEDSLFVPLKKFNLQILSFGFLIDEKQPAIWRGAIINKALNQLLFDTKWGELDILIVDMPPGTGDIHLTMCQKMPLTGVITVTTPQDIALVDVGKSIAMYNKMNIPCLGVIENMSLHTCVKCGHTDAIFGEHGTDKLQKLYNLEILGRLPLHTDICRASDTGIPLIDINPDIANHYHQISEKTLINLSKLPKDYTAKFGTISIVPK